ncbi:MAG: hypothetical protein WBF81_08740 [Thermoplasmata archaeon]
MVLRETTFVLGGALIVGLGVAIVAGLIWAGAGFDYFEAWLGAGIAAGLGAFFIYVGRAETEDRRQRLRAQESDVLSTHGR